MDDFKRLEAAYLMTISEIKAFLDRDDELTAENNLWNQANKALISAGEARRIFAEIMVGGGISRYFLENYLRMIARNPVRIIIDHLYLCRTLMSSPRGRIVVVGGGDPGDTPERIVENLNKEISFYKGVTIRTIETTAGPARFLKEGRDNT